MSEFEDIESKGFSQEKAPLIETTKLQQSEPDKVILDTGLRRGLPGRHISLVSPASVIGASCFYGSGYALCLSGPLGSLLGFLIVGKSRSTHPWK
jgi:amino acid transporter